jgi:hypothetical protein
MRRQSQDETGEETPVQVFVQSWDDARNPSRSGYAGYGCAGFAKRADVSPEPVVLLVNSRAAIGRAENATGRVVDSPESQGYPDAQ